MIAPREMPRLPPGYALREEKPDVLVLRRGDYSVVEEFPLSVTGPSPESIQKVAEKDNQCLREDKRR